MNFDSHYRYGRLRHQWCPTCERERFMRFKECAACGTFCSLLEEKLEEERNDFFSQLLTRWLRVRTKMGL